MAPGGVELALKQVKSDPSTSVPRWLQLTERDRDDEIAEFYSIFLFF